MNPHNPPGRGKSIPLMRRAFTLIDTLIVIAIIGLLVTLLLPAISSARDAARDIVSLSNMRTHTSVFQMYSGDWKDYLPCVTRPDVDRTIIRGCGGWGYSPYFGATQVWPIVLADSYYDGRCQGPEFVHPARRDDILIDYLLSSSIIADPPYWDLTTRTGPRQWDGQKLSLVRFPSDKAVLTETHPVHGVPWGYTAANDSWPIALGLADGSAGRWKPDQLAKPITSGEGMYPGIMFGQGVYGLHTPEGILGRDVIR